MRSRRKHQAHANHERWLVSYADFITLLFAFFVVMFAASNSDKDKAAQVSASVREAMEKGHISTVLAAILGGAKDRTGPGNAALRGPGGSKRQVEETKDGRVAELLPSLEFLTRELSREIADGELQIDLQARGLVISLRQAAFFPSGEDTLEPTTFDSIEKIAEAIRKLPNPVRLEGHTDSVPIHNSHYKSNWELSAARAIAMLELLTGRFGVPRERLAVAGYAETAPVDSNDGEQGRARNRRVDIVILSAQGLKGEPEVKRPSPAGESKK